MKGLLCYGLALVGFGVVFLGVMRGHAMTVSYASVRLSLVNLLRSNPVAALQYCRSVPGTFLDAIAAAMTTAGMMQSRDPKIISSATYPSYDGAGAGIGIAWKMLLDKSKLGAGMSLGAIAAAVGFKMNPIFIIFLAVCSLAGFGWLFWSKMEAERMVVLARHEILPEVDRVFVEGRYAA